MDQLLQYVVFLVIVLSYKRPSHLLMFFFKGFFEVDLVRSLLRECVKMSALMHPNILSPTGVCLDGGPIPYVVIPFMFNGDLLTYLKKERSILVTPLDGEMGELTVSCVYPISRQSSQCYSQIFNPYLL